MMTRNIKLRADLIVLAVLFSSLVFANPAMSKKNEGNMNNQRLEKIIKRLDANATGQSGYWQLSIDGVKLLVVTDESADRMRIISPIETAKKLNARHLYRLMQANYDSALDARYAIAKNTIWSAFIHPLGSLGAKEFISGIGQVVNLSRTYGQSYTSGALVFRGGDSEALQERKLIDRLMDKGLVL